MPPHLGRSPAGWYPDPDDPTTVRYWDGKRWTQHVAVRDRLLTPAVEGGPVGPTAPRSGLVAVALLTTPVLGLFLPFLGPWASAGAAYLAVRRGGPVLWTGGGWPSTHRSAVTLGLAALWLLPVLNILVQLGLFPPVEMPYAPGAAGWLFVPLAGPADHWTPAVVALVVYAVGAALSAWRRRPWPWVVGGVAASVAYDLTLVVADIPYIA